MMRQMDARRHAGAEEEPADTAQAEPQPEARLRAEVPDAVPAAAVRDVNETVETPAGTELPEGAEAPKAVEAPKATEPPAHERISPAAVAMTENPIPADDIAAAVAIADRPPEFGEFPGPSAEEAEPFILEEIQAELEGTGIDLDIADVPYAERGTVVFDGEVMTTFESLRELIGSEEAAEADMAALAGLHEEPPLDPPESEVNPGPEAPAPTGPDGFESLVLARAVSEGVPELETIVAEAEGQALEDTFVRLSRYMAEACDAADINKSAGDADSTTPEAIEDIDEALSGVIELLSPVRSQTAELKAGPETKEVKITPELTQKLLTLLRAVGYDNPREVLLEFISRHDFEFLILAISYLYQLRNDGDCRESLRTRLNLAVPEPDKSLTVRLGRAIVALITQLSMAEYQFAELTDP